MTKANAYIKLVEWSEEDQCYIGSIPGFLGPCCHGDDEEQVYHELRIILDEWLKIHEDEGLPLPPATADRKYSGRFVLRIDPELHKVLVIKAIAEGKSLNQYCQAVLKQALC
jgi:predicted HicB family RNase H-like nuclease